LRDDLVVTSERIKGLLAVYLDREPTKEEYENFLDYLQSEVKPWIRDLAKFWTKEVLPYFS